MRKWYSFLLVVVIMILSEGCASLKSDLVQSGGINETIQNAILDFSTTRFYKNDSVFSITYLDTLYRMSLDKTDPNNYQWIKGGVEKGIAAVGIRSSNNRLLLTADAKVGRKNSKLPTRVIDRDGKLFYWWDKDYPLTEKTLSLYRRYDLLQDDEGGLITVPDFATNDAQKAVHYYFCTKNLANYKKVVTRKGIGYYDLPNLNCE
jgi:hypothetical protein